MGVWAVVVAGGRGTRFGAPKQFESLGAARVVDLALETARASCDGVVLVLPAGVPWHGAGVTAVVGGERRSDSVRAGLEVVPVGAEIVVVHDAARPMASPALFDAVVSAVRDGADGAVPGLPPADTVKRVEGTRVVETVARDRLVTVQTPQAFRAGVLRSAHATGADASDDAALVEAVGGVVVVVPGEPDNLKVTTSADLVVAAALLRASTP